VDEAKPFDIPKREVWEAFKKVKANQGAAGVDGQSIWDFEADLPNNLYKLWNRLSSGSYFPPPVRRADLPKEDGGTRPLGIPTVADRVAQEVTRRYLEPCLEPVFHTDSYGYRPGKSAIDAVRQARQRHCLGDRTPSGRGTPWPRRPSIGRGDRGPVHSRPKSRSAGRDPSVSTSRRG
jgi:RNA-directed DNA polymerase